MLLKYNEYVRNLDCSPNISLILKTPFKESLWRNLWNAFIFYVLFRCEIAIKYVVGISLSFILPSRSPLNTEDIIKVLIRFYLSTPGETFLFERVN